MFKPMMMQNMQGMQANPMFGGMQKQDKSQMKTGDWLCTVCGDHQFARNIVCRKCGADKSQSVDENGQQTEDASNNAMLMQGAQEEDTSGELQSGAGSSNNQNMRPGDWNCSACGDLQFARNTVCRRCGNPRDGADGGMGAGCGACGGNKDMRPGDWACPSCGDHQFARNMTCRKCGEAKPRSAGGMGGCGMGCGMGKGGGGGGMMQTPMGPMNMSQMAQMAQMMMGMANGGGMWGNGGKGGGGKGGDNSNFRPGDWACPSCGDHQFAKNDECRRCGTEKPTDMAAMGKQGMGGCVSPLKPGDWICAECKDLQFARNEACRRCGAAKPPQAMQQGRGMLGGMRGRSRSPRR